MRAALAAALLILPGCQSAPDGPGVEPAEDRRNCDYLETMREMNPGEYPEDDELLRGCD